MKSNLTCNDQTFGFARSPAGVRPCEDGRHPVSRYTIDKEAVDFLGDFAKAAQSPIFRNAALEMCFIWAIDEKCKLHLALEELAIDSDTGLDVQGVPRPRKLRATKGFQKLGHPTLLVGNTKMARIAGELFLTRDRFIPQKLVWGINAESGRFCSNVYDNEPVSGRDRVPHMEQLDNVVSLFAEFGLIINEVDYRRCRLRNIDSAGA
jgi:hypothetical protein